MKIICKSIINLGLKILELKMKKEKDNKALVFKLKKIVRIKMMIIINNNK